MKLSSDEVKHIGKLANLPLSADEEERYSGQLSKILDYIGQLNQADTSLTEPVFNISQAENVTREDQVSASLTQEEALQNAPAKRDGFFVTKGVFEG